MLMKMMELKLVTKKSELLIVECMINMDFVMNVCTDMVFIGNLKPTLPLSIANLSLENGLVSEIV